MNLIKESVAAGTKLLLSVALIAGLASPATAGSLAKSMSVSATVPAVLRYTFDAPRSLTISAEDVARGFVDLPAGSLLQVQTNNPDGYVLRVEPQGDDISSVQVSGLDSPMNVTSAGGSRWFPVQGVVRASTSLGFRLMLSRTATAGERPWPVQVSVMF